MYAMNIYNLFYKAPAPEGIEERNAHIIGGGMAGLAAAVFLIDDAGMPGKNITLYEKRNSLGGCCDAYSGKRAISAPVSVNWSHLWSAFGICAARSRPWKIHRSRCLMNQ